MSNKDCGLSAITEERTQDMTTMSKSTTAELVHTSTAVSNSPTKSNTSFCWVVFMAILCFLFGYWIRTINFGFNQSADLTLPQS